MNKLPFIDSSDLGGDILKIGYVPLSALKDLSQILLAGNPKNHDLDLIIASIEQNGFIDPPKWDTNLNGGNGGIVYGNGRLEGLVQVLNIKKKSSQPPPRGIGVLNKEWYIPIKFGVDAESEVHAKRLAIDHNNLTVHGLSPDEQAQMYDKDLYKDVLRSLRNSDLTPLSIPDEYLEDLIGEALRPVGAGKGNDGKVEINPRCKAGEIWQLGRHRILVGDSCDRSLVEKLLAKRVPDLVWSDPPYGMKCQKRNGKIGSGGLGSGYATKEYPIIAGDENTDTAIASFDLYSELFPSAVHIWWGANHYSSGLPNSSCWIVWDKGNGDNNFADCELDWTNQNSAVRRFDWLWNGMCRAGEAAGKSRVHPNQKPVEMVLWFWDKYCVGEFCFDPFLGSGTTIIAAQKHPTRTVYGFELMPEYAEVAMVRWEEATSEKAVRIS